MPAQAKRFLKKTLSLSIALLLLFTLTFSASLFAAPVEPARYRQEGGTDYIIVTENEASLDAVESKISDELLEESELLEEGNILVAELTTADAAAIDRESGVLFVEEDIIVEASAWLPAGEEETPPEVSPESATGGEAETESGLPENPESAAESEEENTLENSIPEESVPAESTPEESALPEEQPSGSEPPEEIPAIEPPDETGEATLPKEDTDSSQAAETETSETDGSPIEQTEEPETETPETEPTEATPEWNLQAINAEDVLAGEVAAPAGERAKVAVLDSGVDIVGAIDLSGKVNLVPEEQEISVMFDDISGHGTSIAGVIAGNSEAFQGVNPNAELYAVKVFDRDNRAPVSRIIEGIYWCIDNGMNIINMSFGTPHYSMALQQAVQDAHKAGILMMAAAGNNAGAVQYPAAYGQVMAVASTNSACEISEFSNTGEELDIAAPGEKIRTAGFFDGSIVTHGTSLAAPHVTGAASLLWEKDLTKSNEFIRQLLEAAARNIEGAADCGLLDVGYALKIYDEFAESYEPGADEPPAVAENPQAPEDFTYIEDEDNYVEGLWGQGTHPKMTSDAGVTAEEIAVVKLGAVAPDTYATGNKDSPNSVFHGNGESNFIAATILMTMIAQNLGNSSGVVYSPRFGLEQERINTITSKFNSVGAFGLDWATVCGNDYATKGGYTQSKCLPFLRKAHRPRRRKEPSVSLGPTIGMGSSGKKT